MKTLSSMEKKHLPTRKRPSLRQASYCPDCARQAGVIRQILRRPRLQAKLTVGAPNDAYEQEADQVADAVMRMPEEALARQPLEEEEELVQTKPVDREGCCPDLQRQAEEEEEELLQPKRQGGEAVAAGPDLEQALAASRGGGRPLPEESRSFFEPRMGLDLSIVQVHTGAPAADLSRRVNARAFTLGADIYFGAGEFAPGSFEGKKLLAHELTHVVQQRSASAATSLQRDVLDAIGFNLRQSFTRALELPDPIARIFDGVVATNIAMASEIGIPGSWRAAVLEFAGANLVDGAILLRALARLPSFYRGGWIMDLQPNAAAMTLDHSIFVPAGQTLSLATYVHELVHVLQYLLTGTTSFLTSYFGLSGATIAWRWLNNQPTNPMRSSPHEDQAYNLAGRFATWYQSQKGQNPRSITV
ncbi:MAG: DUF4157 domain-containing protein [Desulfobacterales bacterium]|jgi:hypothetical protein